MKNFLAMTFLSAAFLASVGCTQQPTTPGATTPPPPKPATTAPASPATGSPISAASPSGAPASPGANTSSPSPVAGGPSGGPPPSPASSGAPPASVTMETIKHPATGLKLDLPTNWKQEPKGNDTLLVTSPDGNVAIVMSVVPTDKVGEWMDKVTDKLSEFVTDAKVDGGVHEETVNNLPVKGVAGTGKMKQGNTEIEWMAWVVNAKDDKSLAVLAFGLLKNNGETMGKIYKSVKQEGAAE